MHHNATAFFTILHLLSHCLLRSSPVLCCFVTSSCSSSSIIIVVLFNFTLLFLAIVLYLYFTSFCKFFCHVFHVQSPSSSWANMLHPFPATLRLLVLLLLPAYIFPSSEAQLHKPCSASVAWRGEGNIPGILHLANSLVQLSKSWGDGKPRQEERSHGRPQGEMAIGRGST
ncbi:hypothetical protein SEVIR_2G396766v4 [Setaria viridis]